jgi:hypothetical protein
MSSGSPRTLRTGLAVEKACSVVCFLRYVVLWWLGDRMSDMGTLAFYSQTAFFFPRSGSPVKNA